MTDHNPPTLHFPEGFHFECIGCGRCCKQNWDVHTSRKEYDNIIQSDVHKQAQIRSDTKDIMIRDEEKGVSAILNISHQCPMLDEKKLCSIHSIMGVEAKPYTCRQQPIALTHTPDGIYVGGSFICEQMWENIGRPIESYKKDILRWLSEVDKENKIDNEIAFSSQVKTHWRDYLLVEDFIREKIEGEEPLTFRLWKVLTALLIADIQITAKGIETIDSNELLSYLNEAYKVNIEKDEIFFAVEQSLAYGIISLLESIDDEHTKLNTGILLNGGTMYCESLKKEIDTRTLLEYICHHHAPWKDLYYHHYIKHLLWRKYPASNGPITDSIAALSALEHLFTWYMYLSAFSRGAASPSTSDAKLGITKVEILINHHNVNDIIKPFAGIYAHNLRSQLKILLEP